MVLGKLHQDRQLTCAATVIMLSGLRGCRCEWMAQEIKPTKSKHFCGKNFLRRSFSRNKMNVEKDLSCCHRCFESLCQVMDRMSVDFTLVAQRELYRRL